MYFVPLLNGHNWNWILVLGVKKKLEWWGHRAEKKSLTIYSSRVDTIHQCDRQTDGHQMTAKTDLMHSAVKAFETARGQMQLDFSGWLPERWYAATGDVLTACSTDSNITTSFTSFDSKIQNRLSLRLTCNTDVERVVSSELFQTANQPR